jgi:hypothetical protein
MRGGSGLVGAAEQDALNPVPEDVQLGFEHVRQDVGVLAQSSITCTASRSFSMKIRSIVSSLP